jgi:hypothetical protein
VAAHTTAELELQKGALRRMVIVDNESEPGAWERELQRAPWAYGQQKKPTLNEVLWTLRKLGLSVEADIIAAEIVKLKADT